ncbi:MAG: 2-amino-4-hydroxy-6-hydroxymethyldihydropteridine diphosphokinase [Anaerolineales bacterium]
MNAVKSDPPHQAVIGIGSNIFPRDNIRSALHLLGRTVTIQAVSSIWKTSAVGSPGPDFLNAAALVATRFSVELLRNKILRPIEGMLGRIRTYDPNAPRTIDLDILMFDGVILDNQLWEYPHMAVPVGELIPEYVDPNSGYRAAEIAEILRESPDIIEADLDLHWTSTA